MSDDGSGRSFAGGYAGGERISNIIIKWMRSSDHPAKLRLIRYFWQMMGQPLVTVPYVDGTVLQVDPTDYIGRRVILHGFYEREIYQLITTILHRNAVFIDVGCHVGCFSIAAATRCKFVYAIDANPRMIEIIRDTADLNGLHNIEFYAVALSDEERIGEFFLANGNSGRSSLSQTWAKANQSIQVEISTLMSWSSHIELDVIDLLKVDAEGESAKIILGAANMLPRIKNVIFEDSPEADRAIELLSCTGFTVSRPFDKALEPETVNTVFAKNLRFSA